MNGTNRPTIEQVCAFADMQRKNHPRMTAARIEKLARRWLERSWPKAGLRPVGIDEGNGQITLSLVFDRRAEAATPPPIDAI
jgi:hypothetical protein